MSGPRADYSGQLGFFNPEKFGWPVHVIGLGGIGGTLLPSLIKLGVPEIHVWDKDAVEPHNIPCQLVYRRRDIGIPKALAVQQFAERQDAECTIVAHDEFVTATTPLDGVVIAGVDSMRSRRAILDAVKSQFWQIPFYMDGRIGGEQLELYTFSPSDFTQVETYERRWMFADEDGLALPCAERTVIHPVTVLAGLIVAQLTLFGRGLRTFAGFQQHLKTMQSLEFKHPLPEDVHHKS